MHSEEFATLDQACTALEYWRDGLMAMGFDLAEYAVIVNARELHEIAVVYGKRVDLAQACDGEALDLVSFLRSRAPIGDVAVLAFTTSSGGASTLTNLRRWQPKQRSQLRSELN